MRLCDFTDLKQLMLTASAIRDSYHGLSISYSRKVFIPLTKLCRNVCHYCTFAHPPKKTDSNYLSKEEALAIARAGAKAGCREALFTLGDSPELRYRSALQELNGLGHETTLSYLEDVAATVFRETGLLPHLNPGVMSFAEMERLRSVSVSQGLMLETTSDRLCERGGPHFGSPDKKPSLRLATVEAAGKAAIPFTSGILIGIGETRTERLEALLLLRDLHDRYGHIQEVIVQNFRAKAGTKMANALEPSANDHLWTIAMARIVFGGSMNIQAPPNLSVAPLPDLIAAGINDWGGVSPVTPDHVNPERAWPNLANLALQTAASGKTLVERLAVYPEYTLNAQQWIDPSLRPSVIQGTDSEGLARTDSWIPGAGHQVPATPFIRTPRGQLGTIIDHAIAGRKLSASQIVELFGARGEAFRDVCSAANEMRREIVGDKASYIVTRNINYTNICGYHCTFCAFSKGSTEHNLRGSPYNLSLDEITRRSVEAFDRGAVEVCLQGGIHPQFTGMTYIQICRAIKSAVQNIHIHAFSPLEIWQGAATAGMSLETFLSELKAAGLGSLPGTAAEILDDDVRRIICPDKISTEQWLTVAETAHKLGLRTTSTIMFGHVDQPEHWARHLLLLRHLQERTGGITEFVPLPFVPMETPINLRGQCRHGPTFRESVLMHAVARLTFNRLIPNIQTSWVKMGPEGASTCLAAGANDLGGTLMNERITRAAGSVHGQEMSPERMESILSAIGRRPWQRTTLYQRAPSDRVKTSFDAAPLAPSIDTPPARTRPSLQLN